MGAQGVPPPTSTSGVIARPTGSAPTLFPDQATPLPPTAQVTGTPNQSSGGLFDGARAYGDVLTQMNFGARPVGSPGLRATGNYIIQQLKASGWATSTQEFTFRGVPVRNIIGTKGQGPLLIVGAHYDARAKADQ
ncbi:MAG: hypothetical protein ACM3JD_01570, partial [Rudaea sp.]